MDRFFFKLYTSIQKQKAVFFIVLALVCTGLASIAFQVSFEEDISKLIPSNSENEQFQKVLKNIRFTDKVIVNIKKENGTTEDLVNYALELKDSLDSLRGDYIKNIQGTAKEEALFETLDFVYDNLPLFFTETDYAILKRSLSEDSIAKTMEENYKTLISPSGMIAKKQILKDPLHFTNLALQNLKSLGVEEGFKLKNGFIMTEDEQHILLFITPKFPSSDSEKNTIFTERLYLFQEQLNKKFSSKVTGDYYGAVFIAAANAKQVKSDIQLTIGIALTILLLIFIGFYRSVWIPLIILFPTIFGALVSVAFLVLIRPQLSAISLGIGSILLGITLDYSLHILTHIKNGETGKQLYKSITKPILMSSLTTALAFLCLLFINSEALQDLGIFAAVSVLGASVMALLFIPQVYKKKAVSNTKKKTGFNRITTYPAHKNKAVVVCLAVLLVISCFSYNSVEFNKDLEQLNYKPEQLVKAEKELESITNSVSKSVYVATYGATLERALQQNDSVYNLLKGLEKSSEIEMFNSVGGLVASEEKQSEKIQEWNQFWKSERLENVASSINNTSEALGFKPNAFASFYNHLNSNFELLKLSDYPEFGSNMIADYISETNEFATVTSVIKTNENQTEAFQTKVEQLQNTVVIDRKQLNETLLNTLQNDFNTLLWYCFGVVVLALLLFYRNWKLVVVTTVPICLTWLLTIGVMGVFQLQFNVFNSIISAFIFGLGVDYSIFITNALLNEECKNTLATHKTAILLSVITTILGVGVLVFAKHPALHSVALVSVIGIFSAVLIAFIVQPLLFNLLIFKKK
tara:strand:- start:94416 stop:96836 length:2421 start_codon:yes stop_codon:yes gene_type:complete